MKLDSETIGASTLAVQGVRAVAFDAVGTLLHPVPPAGHVYFEAAQRHGSRYTQDEIGRRFRAAFRETEKESPGGSEVEPWTTSELFERERWKTIVERVIDDIRTTDVCFEELFAYFARPQAWRVFDDVPAVLQRLKNCQVSIAIASNFDGRLHHVLDGLPALCHVACRVISAEVGYRKPSRQFYDALLRATGSTPAELLMVGDDLDNDVLGARTSGIQALLIDRAHAGVWSPSSISSLEQLFSVAIRS